jgi:hypothetical protein
MAIISGLLSLEKVATEMGRVESFANPNSDTNSPRLSCSQMSHLQEKKAKQSGEIARCGQTDKHLKRVEPKNMSYVWLKGEKGGEVRVKRSSVQCNAMHTRIIMVSKHDFISCERHAIKDEVCVCISYMWILDGFESELVVRCNNNGNGSVAELLFLYFIAHSYHFRYYESEREKVTFLPSFRICSSWRNDMEVVSSVTRETRGNRLYNSSPSICMCLQFVYFPSLTWLYTIYVY